MNERVTLKFTRPVMHDNVHYEAGDCADVQPDMAQTLIACGAAEHREVAAPVNETGLPANFRERGNRVSGIEAPAPEQEFDAGKMQRDALVAAAVAALMKKGDPAAFSKQTGKLKIPVIEAHLLSLGHEGIQVSAPERDALQAKHKAGE